MKSYCKCYICKKEFISNTLFKDMRSICNDCLKKIPIKCRKNNYSYGKYKYKNRKNSCAHCGWNKSETVIHHVVPRCVGGGDNLDNFITVCPNCHLMIHRGEISIDFDTKKTHELTKDEIKNLENSNIKLKAAFFETFDNDKTNEFYFINKLIIDKENE